MVLDSILFLIFLAAGVWLMIMESVHETLVGIHIDFPLYLDWHLRLYERAALHSMVRFFLSESWQQVIMGEIFRASHEFISIDNGNIKAQRSRCMGM